MSDHWRKKKGEKTNFEVKDVGRKRFEGGIKKKIQMR